jgi:hypothetical protein
VANTEGDKMTTLRKIFITIIIFLLIVNGWLFFLRQSYAANLAYLPEAQADLASAEQRILDWGQCVADMQIVGGPKYWCNVNIGYPSELSHDYEKQKKLVKIITERLK